MFAGILLILIGLGFLLTNLGIVPFDTLRELVRTWWPIVLIALGLTMLLRHILRR